MSELYYWGKPIATQTSPANNHQEPIAHLNIRVQSISCGENHCIVAGEEGVYGLGDNSEGQLGLKAARNSGVNFLKIQLPTRQKIVQVSCGWYHTLLLDQFGGVFSSGRGDNGELGRGKIRNSSKFECVLDGAFRISAGKDHSLALCGSKVMGWGNSKEGQLGLPIKKNYYNPQELNVYPCDFIWAGEKYSIFSTKKGIYGTGLNSDYQLGLGHENIVQMPKKLAIEEEIVYITGGKYVVAGTENRQWYMWGSGVLGIFKYPTKLTFLNGADYVTVGHDFGLFVRSGQVWIWGCNHWGQLGIHSQLTDYATESVFFSSLNLDGFVCGNNILMGYKSTYQTFNRTKMTWSNSAQEQDVMFNQMRQEMHSDSARRENSFDKFYHFNKTDHIREMNRQFMSEDNNSLGQNSVCESSAESGSWPVSHETVKIPAKKKYVKLVNPIKSLPSSKVEHFEKQNRQLKQKLQFERREKEKLHKLHMRNMNSYADNRISSKIGKLQTLVASRNRQAQWLNPLSSNSDQSQPISFRPRPSARVQEMGAKIESLKSQISDMCE